MIAMRLPTGLFEGSAFILTASVTAAYANVYNKKYLSGVSPDWNVWLQTLAGAALAQQVRARLLHVDHINLAGGSSETL
jgi:drug/metabolite transporter (DMT)-like permease